MERKTALVVPEFENETEEVAFWQAHKREVESDLTAVGTQWDDCWVEGCAGWFQTENRIAAVTIRLVSADIEAARKLAEIKVLVYQTYIRMLLHEALKKESVRFSRQKG